MKQRDGKKYGLLVSPDNSDLTAFVDHKSRSAAGGIAATASSLSHLREVDLERNCKRVFVGATFNYRNVYRKIYLAKKKTALIE